MTTMKDDLISKAAAIDAVEEIPWYHQNDKGEMVQGANSAEHQAWYKADDIYHALDTLPPAQPVEDIHREKEQAYYCGYEDGTKAARFTQPELSKDVNDILAYLDCVVHPIMSPEYWNAYSMLHDMVSGLLKHGEGGQDETD